MTNEQKKLWLPLLAIAGAMAIWGTILGIGAYLSPSGKYAGADVRKFLVLATTTSGFLLFWALVLIPRAARLRRQSRDQASSGPSPDKD